MGRATPRPRDSHFVLNVASRLRRCGLIPPHLDHQGERGVSLRGEAWAFGGPFPYGGHGQRLGFAL